MFLVFYYFIIVIIIVDISFSSLIAFLFLLVLRFLSILTLYLCLAVYYSHWLWFYIGIFHSEIFNFHIHWLCLWSKRSILKTIHKGLPYETSDKAWNGGKERLINKTPKTEAASNFEKEKIENHGMRIRNTEGMV